VNKKDGLCVFVGEKDRNPIIFHEMEKYKKEDGEIFRFTLRQLYPR